MDLAKLRIMQQIQIALVEKGFIATITSSGRSKYSNLTVQDSVNAEILESAFDFDATESDLQLWHDTIVYGPQMASNGE